MNKSEWDAMDANEKNELVLVKVLDGRIINDPTESWCRGALKTDHGYTCQINKAWADGVAPRYTSDRNACALVLDEIAYLDEDRDKDGIVDRFESILFDVSGAGFGGWGDLDTLRVSPDLLCYCAVEAVEDAS